MMRTNVEVEARRRPGPPTRTQLHFEAGAPADGVAAERGGLRGLNESWVKGR
jgi:hypothetical protein